MKKHYISLGYFCSVASELEVIGLRNESSPFDWLISDFEGVISAIRNNFEDFTKYEYLLQHKQYPAYYLNKKYNVQFYHDFNKYTPLKEQLPSVEAKYKRRIKRFYESISEPTLFVRYISDEKLVDGVSKELIWIEENYDSILALIKSFNSDNEILFIANEGVETDKFHIYHVKKDAGKVINNRPITTTPVLLDLFNSFDFPERQNNIKHYNKKKKHKIISKIKGKIASYFKKIFLSEYVHEIQYSIEN